MKPDWKPTVNGLTPSWLDAPEWANYAAMDASGFWCWYQYTPEKHDDIRVWVRQKGKFQGFFPLNNWQSSLTKRPEK